MSAVGRMTRWLAAPVAARPVTADENFRMRVATRRRHPLFDVAGEVEYAVFALAASLRPAARGLVECLDVGLGGLYLFWICARPLAHERFVFFAPSAIVVATAVFVLVAVGMTVLVLALTRANPLIFTAKALAFGRTKALGVDCAHHDRRFGVATVGPFVAIDAIGARLFVANANHVRRTGHGARASTVTRPGG